MIDQFAPLLSYLGVFGGFIIAHFVKDETKMYAKYFFWSAALFAVLTGLFTGISVDVVNGEWMFVHSIMLLGVLLGAGFAYSLHRFFWFGLVLCTTALTFSTSLFAWELAFVMFIPATAYLINKGYKKRLYYFLISFFLVLAIIVFDIVRQGWA